MQEYVTELRDLMNKANAKGYAINERDQRPKHTFTRQQTSTPTSGVLRRKRTAETSQFITRA